MSENELLFRGKNTSVVSLVDKAESETPLCDLIKAVYALKLAQRSACSLRKKRHAIFRLRKALIMLLHVRK